MLNKIISKIKPKSLDNFFSKLNFFKDKHIGKAKHYLFGLMNGFKRFNIETLSLATADDQYSYRQLYHFIDKADWDEDKLNERRIQFLESDVRTETKKGGCVSIDDTSVRKNGKHTDGTYYQYCGSEGRMTDCKVVVTSHYSDDTKDFPLDAENYYQDDVSKLDLACSIIDRSIKRNLSFNWINFDSWYCTKQVIKKVEEHHKYFISYLKSNRIVRYNDQRMAVSDLVKIISAEHAGETFDCGEIYIKSLGKYRLVIKDEKCFVTNNFEKEITAKEIIKQYKKRWAIDDFYKKAKDDLSFGQFQTRKGLSIMRHWTMVFLAHSFYLHCKLKGVFSKIYQESIISLSDFTKLLQNLNLVRVAKDQTNVLLAKFKLNSLN